MRKKVRISSKPTRKPTKRTLQLNKEIIRTLNSDELTQVATGIVQLACPAGSITTNTTKDPGSNACDGGTVR